MLNLQNIKTQVLIHGAAPTNAETTTSATLDTLGYNEVALILTSTTSNNATNKPATLKLQESDTTDSTNFSDITKAVGGGTGGFTIANMPTATTLNTYLILTGSLLGHKRYLRLLVSPLTTQTFDCVAILSRGEQAPVSATNAGAAVRAVF